MCRSSAPKWVQRPESKLFQCADSTNLSTSTSGAIAQQWSSKLRMLIFQVLWNFWPQIVWQWCRRPTLSLTVNQLPPLWAHQANVTSVCTTLEQMRFSAVLASGAPSELCWLVIRHDFFRISGQSFHLNCPLLFLAQHGMNLFICWKRHQACRGTWGRSNFSPTGHRRRDAQNICQRLIFLPEKLIQGHAKMSFVRFTFVSNVMRWIIMVHRRHFHIRQSIIL